MKRKPKDPCSPRSRKHQAAVAYLLSRGIAQPRALYADPLVTARVEPIRARLRLTSVAR